MPTYDKRDPSGEIVAASTPVGTGGTAGNAARGLGLVRTIQPLVASRALHAAWINPAGTTIYARPIIVFTTAGTGTMDCGTSTGGTGTSDDFINGGTQAIGVYTPALSSGASGVDGISNSFIAMGGSGSAGDTITVTGSAEGATGSYAGFLVVEYFTS